MITLKPFQQKAVESTKTALSRYRSVLLQSATGSGKTVIAGGLAKDLNQKILAVMNLQVLVSQTYDTFKDGFGLDVSVLHDELIKNNRGESFKRGFDSQVVITMPETFINARTGKNQLPFDVSWKPDYLWFDECHKNVAAGAQQIRDWYQDTKILGTSASPYREKNEEGESLREWYQYLVTTISVEELIRLGVLVKPVYLEFDENDHLIKTWLEVTKNSKNKKTIVFTKDTRDSMVRLKAFRESGIKAEIITSGSDIDPDNPITKQTPSQRMAIINEFMNSDLDVLISVMALAEGFDAPIAKFCFLARKIGNHALYHQILGRVLRSHPMKNAGIIVDFYGNLEEYGPIETYEWNLDDNPASTKCLGLEREIPFPTYVRYPSIMVRCTQCNHVYDAKKNRSCYHCGSHTEFNIKVEKEWKNVKMSNKTLVQIKQSVTSLSEGLGVDDAFIKRITLMAVKDGGIKTKADLASVMVSELR